MSQAVPLPSTLPVGALVSDVIRLASLAAAELVARRVGGAPPEVELDPLRVATAVTTERHFRIGGERPAVWSEYSGFWRASDGWVRTHGNYPHHRERLLSALGLAFDAGRAELADAIAGRGAQELEDAVAALGGVLARVRTAEQWRAHEQSRAVAAHPLLDVSDLGDAGFVTPRAVATRDAPAAGLRVLDLTRVLAGPVATRTLALLGADVLRVDSPRNPEIEWQHLDTGAGKRSTLLDLGRPTDRAVFDELLSTADVVVTGYRAASLDKYGLAPAALAERRPGIVVANLTAWGTDGPFATRRGFDSIVQAATGIAWLESPDGETPGALPAQALDHSAGYLLAAGVLTALREGIDTAGSRLVETSLARVAQTLLEAPRAPRAEASDWEPTVEELAGLTLARPAVGYVGGPRDWPSPPVAWGSSDPSWR